MYLKKKKKIPIVKCGVLCTNYHGRDFGQLGVISSRLKGKFN